VSIAAPAQSEHRSSARERLLDAANDLFYAEGVQTVGVDRIIERAGVAKASLYNLFGSKEELVAAYLASRHERTTTRLTEAIANVELEAGGVRLVASITVEAVRQLGLAEGSQVTAVIKASDVILATGS